MKAVLRKGSVLLAAVALTVLGLEAVLTLFGAHEPNPPLYPAERRAATGATIDPAIGWKLPPEGEVPESAEDYSVVYRANREGFRDPRDFDRPTARQRITVLGDSYTFGTGVEEAETFTRLLESRLANVRSYNFGIGGFGVDQMWLTLRHYALDTQPDLVLLAFIRNDLDRARSAYRLGHGWLAKPTFKLEAGRLEPLTAADRPHAAWRWIERHSRLLELARRVEYSVGWRYPVGYTWKLNRALFEAIRDDCRRAGTPLVVIHIPVNRRTPSPMLTAEFERMEIPFLDLVEHLPPGADALYFEHDPHFSPAGHRFAAEEIARFLIERGLARPAR